MKKADKLFTKLFDEIIDRPLSKSSSKKSPKIKPSMLGTPCLRKLYYSYNRVEEDEKFPLKNVRIMKLGTAVGDMFAETFREAGLLIDYVDEDGNTPTGFDGKPNHEFPISIPEFEIPQGFIDLVAVIDGKLWLGEVKSSNNFAFGKLRNPKSDHLIQGLVYLYAFNKMLKAGKFKHIKALNGFSAAEGIRFIYLNKDSSTMKEFTITRDDKAFIQIAKKIALIKKYSSAKTLPSMTEHFCGSCQWRVKCAQNFNNI